MLRIKIDEMVRKFEKKLTPLNRIEVSRSRVLKNYLDFGERDNTKQFWPVIKSNAYGHGVEQIGEILKNERFDYWVADSLVEAMRIGAVSKKRVLLIGPILRSNFSLIDCGRITLSVQNIEDLEALGKLNKHIKVHLKVNTGMNRQGFDKEELQRVLEILKKQPQIEVEGVFSHLADGGNAVSVENQESEFGNILTLLENNGVWPKWRHLAATEGAFKTKDVRINAVRLGLGMYKNTLKLISTITKKRWAEKGEKVSYGGTYSMPEGGWLGVIPVGYYEALDRKLSNKGVVKYRDEFYPIAGRVCMNMCVINFGKTKVNLNDEVEVVGMEGKNSFEEMAKACETIDYELMVRLNQSIKRLVV